MRPAATEMPSSFQSACEMATAGLVEVAIDDFGAFGAMAQDDRAGQPSAQAGEAALGKLGEVIPEARVGRLPLLQAQ